MRRNETLNGRNKMTTVDLYPDTDCNSGTCGMTIPFVNGKKTSAIAGRKLREVLAACKKRFPGAVVTLEKLTIKESWMDQIIGR